MRRSHGRRKKRKNRHNFQEKRIFFKKRLDISKKRHILKAYPKSGVLAQLARASRWQREGHGFKSHILHQRFQPVERRAFLLPGSVRDSTLIFQNLIAPSPLCCRRDPLKSPFSITFSDLKEAAAPSHSELIPLPRFTKLYAYHSQATNLFLVKMFHKKLLLLLKMMYFCIIIIMSTL